MIEEETTEDVDALKSDIENLQDEAEKFRANLQQAKQQLDECKAAEKEVEEKLAAVCARIREANHSIDPLKVRALSRLYGVLSLFDTVLAPIDTG